MLHRIAANWCQLDGNRRFLRHGRGLAPVPLPLMWSSVDQHARWETESRRWDDRRVPRARRIRLATVAAVAAVAVAATIRGDTRRCKCGGLHATQVILGA